MVIANPMVQKESFLTLSGGWEEGR